MNEYLILDAAASVHTALDAEENPMPRVLIISRDDGMNVQVVGTNAEEVAGLRSYFDSEEWRITARETDTPLDLFASRSETTMNATRGDLDAEGDDVALEAAEDIRDALEAETPEQPRDPSAVRVGGPVAQPAPEAAPPAPEEEPTEDV